MLDETSLSEVIATAIRAAEDAVRERYPASSFTVLVVAVPVARELLADAPVAAKSAITEQIIRAVPEIRWPFEGADGSDR